ncbi:MAG: hypothetical protein RM347_005445 [Nostoc sp. ChiQUE02]|uniref:hypothetical protein n=1 Tax=Nostoc sp. ChiQUE02 TaxID=3075377 RepID=UPI002AD47487|nr:hypothetical protein [Nostoc sp. ChiQUE02]MDZ8231177.1 hypothetical protein [Nostoc sp. ChiQUE02]
MVILLLEFTKSLWLLKQASTLWLKFAFNKLLNQLVWLIEMVGGFIPCCTKTLI